MKPGQARRKQVIVTAGDLKGSHASGRGLRAIGLADALAAHFDVFLVCDDQIDVAVPDRVNVAIGPTERRQLLATADVVVTANELSGRELALLRGALIVDLYDPFTFELPWIELKDHERTKLARCEHLFLRFALRHADLILCANEPQRDLYLGARLALLPYQDGYSNLDRDGNSSMGIVVVPNGIDSDEPLPDPDLRLRLGLAPDDVVLTWGGGVWDFLDPGLALAATLRARASEPRLKLFFLGISRPQAPNSSVAKLLDACRAAGDAVVVNERWVPSACRGAYLAASQAGVLAQRPGLETHFSFRTRLVDCMWARLPVVATAGDTLTQQAVNDGWAVVSAPGDVEGLAAAMLKLADPQRRLEMRSQLERARPSWTWKSRAEPLIEAIDTLSLPDRFERAARSAGSLTLATSRRIFGTALSHVSDLSHVARAP